MTTAAGTTTSERRSIADVFATFYEELYGPRQKDEELDDTTTSIQHDPDDTIPSFSMKELTTGLKQLRSGKCTLLV